MAPIQEPIDTAQSPATTAGGDNLQAAEAKKRSTWLDADPEEVARILEAARSQNEARLDAKKIKELESMVADRDKVGSVLQMPKLSSLAD